MAQLVEVTTMPRLTPPSAAEFEQFFDALADALYDCEGIFDQDVAGDGETGALRFAVAVETEDPAVALQEALTAVRTAMHTAGARTPGWEKYIEDGLSQIASATRAAPEVAAA